MFENINFYSQQIKSPVTSDTIKRKLFGQDYPNSIKNTDFSIAGTLQMFTIPPATEFAMKNLYHMEGFSLFSCESNFFTQRKDFHSFLILYTYKGQGQLEYGGRTYSLSEGDGFFIDCRFPQRYQTIGTFWKHSVLHINGPLTSSLFQQYSSNSDGSVTFSQPVNGTYQTGLEKLLSLHTTSQPYRDWLVSDCISSLLTGLLGSSSSGTIPAIPDNYRNVIKYMENHFSSDICLDDLSRFAGVSKYYLSREFKKFTGFSPNDYLIRLRIEQAKSLLLTTSLPANKIAHMVGIHDPNNFTNLFKKKTGLTPGQFKQQYI